MQRFFDVIFSAIAIILLSPLLIPIVIVLKFTGEGEIFYKQNRVGKNGKEFGLLKFSTMLKDSPNLGSKDITLKNDPRILPFGKFLRKTKINELPQIINVFLGNMSIVGYRPMVPRTFEKYGDDRHLLEKIKPGLTGVGSIIFRNEEKYLSAQEDAQKFYFDAIVPYKIKLEMWYIERASLYLYFKLIFITAWVVLFPESNIQKKWLPDIPEMPGELLEVEK